MVFGISFWKCDECGKVHTKKHEIEGVRFCPYCGEIYGELKIYRKNCQYGLVSPSCIMMGRDVTIQDCYRCEDFSPIQDDVILSHRWRGWLDNLSEEEVAEMAAKDERSIRIYGKIREIVRRAAKGF